MDLHVDRCYTWCPKPSVLAPVSRLERIKWFTLYKPDQTATADGNSHERRSYLYRVHSLKWSIYIYPEDPLWDYIFQ